MSVIVINSIHRSIFFSAIERYGNVIFFVVSTAVLSRLLTPQEIGIYAVVGALTTVAAASFREFGGANYLIQKPSLSERDIRSAFTVTLCLSVILAATAFELRDVAAWYFSEQGLRIGIAAAALNFVLQPFTMTITALLRRDMAFGILARCNLAGSFITAVTSIVLAVLNYSFMAPIWGTIAGNVVVLALLTCSRRNLRIFRPSFYGYRDVFSFGAYSGGTVIINVLYNLAPQLILARIIGFSAVGFYSRAINVTQLFDRLVIQVLGPVIMPAVSAHKRAGFDLKQVYLDAVELSSVAQWPFMIFIALMADPIIRIWFGPAWSEIVPLIQLLCGGSLFLFAACLTYPVLVAAGHVRDTLISSLISLPPSLLAIYIAALFGLHAVAASALLTLPFQAMVALYFIGRRLGIDSIDLLRAMAKSLIVTLCSVAPVLASTAIMDINKAGPAWELIAAATLAAVGWFFGILVTKHPLLAQLRLAAAAFAVAAEREIAGLRSRRTGDPKSWARGVSSS